MTRVKAAGNYAGAMQSSLAPSMSLSRLRELVHAELPSDRLAKMAADNPVLAENEVRSICRRLFDDDAVPGFSELGDDRRERLVDQLIDGIFGLGPIEALLADEAITEVLINGVHSVYFERGGVLHRFNQQFSSEDEIRALIDRIIGPLGRRIDESSPMVNARLEDGSRVHAIIPPISLIGPVVSIRRFTRHVITLAEMSASGSIDASLEPFLRWAVRARLDIAVSGGTGTGKTTMLNALSCEIPETERVITIEDSAELRFLEHPHVVRLESRAVNAEGLGEVTIRDLVVNALRMRPDRIVVGECRGAEALDMLQAMNTGHDGSLTTLHANSPDDAILRLMTMVRYAADLPVDVIERQITSAIDLGIHIARDAEGMRYVTRVVEYVYGPAPDRARADTIYRRDYAGDRGRWLRIPSWVDELERDGVASKEEVEAWKRQRS